MPEWMIDWWGVACFVVPGAMVVCALLAPRLAKILAGISEVEEAHVTQESKEVNHIHPPSDLHLLQTDDLQHTSRPARSPVRSPVRSPQRLCTRSKRGARRSLSLPSGGLSYGEVKILYKDGHFVTVDAGKDASPSSATVSPCRDDKRPLFVENGPIAEEPGNGEFSENVGVQKPGQRLRRGSTSSRKGSVDEADLGMRAEILSLLERGITDPQRVFSEVAHALDSGTSGGFEGRRSRSGAPVFLSLPRRRNKGQRPMSVDEVQLWKYYSKSQQSLVSQGEIERRRQEEEEEKRRLEFDMELVQQRLGDCAGLKRNNSFTEAMGSNMMRNDPKTNFIPQLSEAAEESLVSEKPREGKSHGKGPGFIQRMLQKRKGSSSSSLGDKLGPNTSTTSLCTNPSSISSSSSSLATLTKNDSQSSLLTSSSLSLNNHVSKSPVKNGGRDSSVGRKMSLKGLFKRKSSVDLTSAKNDVTSTRNLSSSSEEPGSPPIARFLHTDDIGAVPGTAVLRGLVHHEEEVNLLLREGSRPDSNSHLHQVPRTPSPQQSSKTALQRSQSHVESVRRKPPSGAHCSNIRPRSGSAGARCRHQTPVRPERPVDVTPQKWVHAGPDSASSPCNGTSSEEGTLTPRSPSPNPADTTVIELADTTLVASSPSGRLSPPLYQQLTASPGSARRRRSSRDSDGDSPAMVDKTDITSSNSNDSGIQHDANSSAESIQTTVRLRKSKSPSPTSERPKSDITVRWADLLEEVMDPSTVRHRGDAVQLRSKPRPKSDIDEHSTEDDNVFIDENDEEKVDDNEENEVDEQTEERVGTSQARTSSCSLGSDSGMGHVAGSSGNISFATSSGDVSLRSGESVLSLVELRRPTRDAASAKLAKSRRMSTPQPISVWKEKPNVKTRSSQPAPTLTHAHSMPDNLDRLSRKKHYFSLIASDAVSLLSQRSGGDESSDESEYSLSCHPDKSLSTQSSHVMLAALDQMLEEENLTYAEALWDHVTMDPEELGFRAGDLIRVTDATDKHWWFGVVEDNEGWFPATFVRLRVNQEVMEDELAFWLGQDDGEEEMTISHHGVLGSAPSAFMGKHQARANVVNEIITAEREYVKHLCDVVEGYVKNAKKRPEMFPVEKVAIIFSNIEDIYQFARDLLAQLDSEVDRQQPHLSELGQCFLDHVKGFEMYSDYCNNHPAACEELRELYRIKRYRHFFEACRLLQDMIEIPLEGFLLTPVQKICKYHLQLAELLKFTPADHPDHPKVKAALEAMKKIATLINERKRKMESIEKLATWQMMVDDWEGADILEESSELIHSGELHKINHAGWSQERYFFLFDHQLIYCKKDLLKKSTFGYKGRINMDNCQVISVADGRDPQYNVTVRNAWKLHEKIKDKWYLLVAKTAVAKQRWIKAFQDERSRVKDDAENNFNIPVHVKQAVIANLKQKTNLNKPKGKSRFSRANSASALGRSSQVDALATLPRKSRSKVKSDGSVGKKINWFFLGKGKSHKV